MDEIDDVYGARVDMLSMLLSSPFVAKCENVGEIMQCADILMGWALNGSAPIELPRAQPPEQPTIAPVFGGAVEDTDWSAP